MREKGGRGTEGEERRERKRVRERERERERERTHQFVVPLIHAFNHCFFYMP